MYKYRSYASDKGKPPWQVYWRKLKTFLRLQLGIPNPLVVETILDRILVVRQGTVRHPPDFDDAWFLALAQYSKVILDIGANVGYTALLASLSPRLEAIVLVDANPNALAIAAENLIRNHLETKARFLCAFAGVSTQGGEVDFWTYDTAAAGSMYRSSFKRIGASSFIKAPTVTIDWMCEKYRTVPDLVKLDIEGAEYQALLGGTQCAKHQSTRFLVEMHSNPDLSMLHNAERVLRWCRDVEYKAWYLAEGKVLEQPETIQHRSRCHLLLQPAAYTYPTFLEGIDESTELSAVPLAL